MKRLIGFSVLIGSLILSGCLDTVEETTFNEDGSGVYSSTADMSKVFTMLGALGGGGSNDKLKDIEKIAIDTIMMMKDMQDSTVKLTSEEKKLIEKGTVRVIMNYKEEKFTTTYSVPFSKPADILALNTLIKSSKGDVFQEQMKMALPNADKGSDDDMPMMGDGEGEPDLNGYFDITYEKSKLKKKINKEKYANVKDDKNLQTMMEMGQMGMPVNFKTVINLPRPVKKAEGKGVTVSENKKTITIEGTLDDFMEDPSKFEYEIEY